MPTQTRYDDREVASAEGSFSPWRNREPRSARFSGSRFHKLRAQQGRGSGAFLFTFRPRSGSFLFSFDVARALNPDQVNYVVGVCVADSLQASLTRVERRRPGRHSLLPRSSITFRSPDRNTSRVLFVSRFSHPHDWFLRRSCSYFATRYRDRITSAHSPQRHSSATPTTLDRE